jgi:hypothetical protein
MRNAHRRVEQLESQIQGRWPAKVEAAKARALARVRLKIAAALGVVDDPALTADHARLANDSPEQGAADREVLQRWAREHPATLYPDDGARARIAAKLEEMSQRMQARKDDEPEDAA